MTPIDRIALIIGYIAMTSGGAIIALGLIYLAFDQSLKVLGCDRRAWWDVFCEMHRQGKLRGQKKRE